MRKGFLAALALVVGSTSAQAQYWPAQRPVYPPPNYGPMWAPQQAPNYYNPNQMPRVFVPVANPNYLPRGYFPAPAAQSQGPVVAREGQSTPVPPEPSTAPASGTPEVVSTPTVSRPVAISGPQAYFDTLPASLPPSYREPVSFHRECHERMWAGWDTLFAWTKNGPLKVPLVTTGSIDVSSPGPGAIGQPGTIVLFGNQNLDFRMFYGNRLEVGRFFDDCNRFSMDVGVFWLYPRHVNFEMASDADGRPILSRPVFDTAFGSEFVYAVAQPGTVTNGTPISELPDPAFVPTSGGISVDARSVMAGAEVNGRWHAYCGRNLHAQLLTGFRTLRLEEHLIVRDRLTPQARFAIDDDTGEQIPLDSGLTFKNQPVLPGETIRDIDSFRCFNQFYGFQLGGSLRWEAPRVYVDVYGKVALGVTDQQVRIEGASSLTQLDGSVQTAVGGILALPSNMGDHNRQIFGVVPEVGINFAADLTCHLRVKGGYSCLFWSGVTRPGLNVDRFINSSQVPTDNGYQSSIGSANPRFDTREQVFFLQAINLGLEFHY